MCQAYATLGARGTSILVSSGDAGPDGGLQEGCNDFNTVFPAACP